MLQPGTEYAYYVTWNEKAFSLFEAYYINFWVVDDGEANESNHFYEDIIEIAIMENLSSLGGKSFQETIEEKEK